jgi:hypothetical protein
VNEVREVAANHRKNRGGLTLDPHHEVELTYGLGTAPSVDDRWEIDHFLRRHRESLVACVTHDAHDLVPIARPATQAPPQSILIRPPPAGERLADDSGARPVRAIIVIKRPPLEQRHTEGSEESWTRRVLTPKGSLTRALGVILEPAADKTLLATEWDTRDQPYTDHTRLRLQTLSHLPEEICGLSRPRDLSRRHRQTNRHHALGVEARIHGAQSDKTSEHQSGSRQKDQRQRDLRDHEAAPHETAPSSVGHTLGASITELPRQIGGSIAQHRKKTKDQSGPKRNRGRESEHSQVDAHLRNARNIGRREARGYPHRHGGDAHAERSAHPTENETLTHERPDHLHSASPHRDPEGHLPLAHFGAHQE